MMKEAENTFSERLAKNIIKQAERFGVAVDTFPGEQGLEQHLSSKLDYVVRRDTDVSLSDINLQFGTPVVWGSDATVYLKLTSSTEKNKRGGDTRRLHAEVEISWSSTG